VAGCGDLAKDSRFANNGDRVKNRGLLVPMLAEIFAQRTTADWVGALDAAGVPCGPINTLAQAFAEPQAQARGMKLSLPHPLAGEVPLIGSPMKFSGTPVTHELPPPLLGQHSEEILRGVLGMSAEDVAKLRASGAM
jgi:crotonobetainyl-CoA:carnitine CoA-transferase CaiB-like acyl-CoA transferase